MFTDYTVPIGSVHIPSEEWVSTVSEKKLVQEFDAGGSDAKRLIGCFHQPNQWYIHGHYPQLNTYVKGKVAILGDAVRPKLLTCRRK